MMITIDTYRVSSWTNEISHIPRTHNNNRNDANDENNDRPFITLHPNTTRKSYILRSFYKLALHTETCLL